jgi:hypothetical protein
MMLSIDWPSRAEQSLFARPPAAPSPPPSAQPSNQTPIRRLSSDRLRLSSPNHRPPRRRCPMSHSGSFRRPPPHRFITSGRYLIIAAPSSGIPLVPIPHSTFRVPPPRPMRRAEAAWAASDRPRCCPELRLSGGIATAAVGPPAAPRSSGAFIQ